MPVYTFQTAAKIVRTAELAKIPVVAVIGIKEMAAQILSIRTRKGRALGGFNLVDLHQRMQQVIADKSS